MSFIDAYLSQKVPGYPCVSAPRTRTSILATAGGREKRNQEWEHPLHHFVLPEATRDWVVVDEVAKHWRVMRGPFHSWPWRDPLDFASADLERPNIEPEISATDQQIGVGDGIARRFQLVKTYTLGSESYVRPIVRVVLASVLVAIDGVPVDPAGYTVSRETGVVEFLVAPLNDAVITAGYLFDVEVRFVSDDQLEGILRSWQVAGYADLELVEVRPR